MNQHHFPVRIFYEDTDHSGVVYHPNYLKYFERAREMAIGPDELSRLWHEDKSGFAVYKSDVTYHEGAVFGDVLSIRSRWEMDGKYKMNWYQEACKKGREKPIVTALIVMVYLVDGNLAPVPVLNK